MTTDHTAKVTHFPMGSDVPEWLLMLIPQGPQSVKDQFRFAMDVDVIDHQDYFMVVPTALEIQGIGILDMAGTRFCNVWAADKMVRVAIGQTHFWPPGTDIETAQRQANSGPVVGVMQNQRGAPSADYLDAHQERLMQEAQYKHRVPMPPPQYYAEDQQQYAANKSAEYLASKPPAKRWSWLRFLG